MTAALTAQPEAARWSADNVDLAELVASPAGLSGRELGDRLVELDRVRRAVEAATVALLDEAERSDAYHDDGCTSLGSWARCQVLWSKHEATTRVRELDLVRLCPEVATALQSGTLGTAQVAELARARANPRAGDAIADHITQLLQWATELDFDGFRTVVRRWEQLADVDGAHHSAKTAHDGRQASLNRIDDTFHLRAQFGVIQGTAIAKILDAFVEAEWQADWDHVKALHGDDARPNMVARSEAQRRADALFAIFNAAVSGDGRTIADPLVHLVCDLATFEEHLARTMGGHVPDPADFTYRGTPHHNDDDDGDGSDDDVDDDGDDADPGNPLDVAMGIGFAMRRCETIDGDPVDLSDVIAATLVGHVRIVVVDRRGVVVNAGRKTRLYRGVSRGLVWLLGKTCCWRGCGHRLDVQVDHLDEYVRDGGGTDQANAGPLHGRHNRFKTSHGYKITRDDRGILHIWRPDGTELKPQ
jgi:hypothetical protein